MGGEKAVKFRPFTSLKDLHEKMVGIVADSPQTEQLELIRSHPDLGANIKMSSQSVSEQEEAGLRDLTEEEFRSFHHLNEIYQQRFQFPFIFAVKENVKLRFTPHCERGLLMTDERNFRRRWKKSMRSLPFVF